MKEIRSSAAVAVLGDGRVLVAGGYSLERVHQTSEIFDPVTRTWAEGPPLGEARYDPEVGVLADGSVIVAGGANLTTPSRSLSSVEIWKPGSSAFELVSPMAMKRHRAAGAVLPDGRFLVVGGQTENQFTSHSEVYDPASGMWSTVAAAPWEIGDAKAVPLFDGRVLLAGGSWLLSNKAAFGHTFSLIYDPASDSWASTSATTVQSALLSSTFTIPTSTGMTVPSTWRGDARFGGGFALLEDGRVLSAGGQTNVRYGLGEEIFDPRTNAWTKQPGMRWQRQYFAHAVRLPDGKVLATGSTYNPDGALEAEIFDPGSGTWSSAGQFPFPPGGMLVAPLRDGSVLFMLERPRLGDTVVLRAAIYSP